MTEQDTEMIELEETDFVGMEQLEFVDFKQKYVSTLHKLSKEILKVFFSFRLLEGKTLFKDRDFPPNDASFSQTKGLEVPSNMKWMRASDISKNPKFFVGGATRFDVNQGKLQILKKKIGKLILNPFYN